MATLLRRVSPLLDTFASAYNALQRLLGTGATGAPSATTTVGSAAHTHTPGAVSGSAGSNTTGISAAGAATASATTGISASGANTAAGGTGATGSGTAAITVGGSTAADGTGATGSSGTETIGAYFQHRLPRAWAKDGDGARSNGGGLIGAAAKLTAQAAGLAQVFDTTTGEYQALETSVALSWRTVNYQVLPDVPEAGDALLLGFAVPVIEWALDMGTVQTYTGDGGKWQYSTGAGTWSDLAVFDNTDASAQDGKRPLGRDGAVMLTTIPSDWASATYNGQAAYWVRWLVVTAANVNVLGVTNNCRHDLVTADEGWMPPHACALDAAIFADAAATMHAANPVVVVFWDATTGESRTASFTASRRYERAVFSGWNLTTAARISAFCIAEDGTNEPSDALMALGGSFATGNHTHTGPSHTHTGPSHDHAAGAITVTDPGHDHAAGTLASPTSGTPSATTAVGTDTHTHTGPSHSHAAGTLAVAATGGPSATTTVPTGAHTHVPTSGTIHADVSEVTVALSASSDLTTACALLNQMRSIYEGDVDLAPVFPGHRSDTLAHLVADDTNTVPLGTYAQATDLTTAEALANALKAAYNTHRTQSGVHRADDTTNVVTAAAATDLSTTVALANDLRVQLLAHLAAGLAAPALRVVDQ